MSDQNLTPEILVPKLGNYLVEKKLITDIDLKRALEYQSFQSSNEPPQLIGQILVKLGIIDRKSLDQAITEQIIQLRNALQEANATLERRVQERTSELNSAYQKLSELDRLKSNFVSNISHELRTPLTHLSGYLDLLSSGDLGPLEERQNQALQVLNKAYHRLSRLIDDLILFSLVERGKLELNMQKTSLAELFNDLKNQFASYSTGKQVDIMINCAPNMPPVNIDRNRILWVLLQFIDNAIKFSQALGKISIEAEPINDKVLVSITDTGIGIPEDKVNEIFEPFHQLDGSSSRKFGGTGLGLSLAQEIIEAHNSKISVSSQVGIGTKFQFYLQIFPTIHD